MKSSSRGLDRPTPHPCPLVSLRYHSAYLCSYCPWLPLVLALALAPWWRAAASNTPRSADEGPTGVIGLGQSAAPPGDLQ